MKLPRISAAMLVVSLLFAPALLAQSPTAANQSAVPTAQSPATPDVPRLIKFSGTLLDAQDRPMVGPVGVTLAIYAQQTGGAALWLETQNVKPDGNGNYNVLLGAETASGLPTELFAPGESRWLGVQAEHQVEQPRVLLVSVPYALRAGDAQTLGGKPPSAYALSAPGAVLVAGTTGGSAASAISTGGTPLPATACTSVTSDGTAAANSISLFTTACNVESSMISQVSGNVGIGTAAPGVALDVLGNNAGLRLSGTGTHQVTVTGATSGRLGQDSSGFFFASDTNGKTVRFLTNNGTLNEWMRITSAGNVGVGTTAPAQKLSVAGAIQSTTGGFIFPDSTVQTTAGKGGTITAVNTAAGSGLIGGVTSGAANLSLTNTCGSGQVLQWSGAAWGCAFVGTGTVTSVGSGLGLTGGPISGSGTLAIDPTVVPQLGATNIFTNSQSVAASTSNAALTVLQTGVGDALSVSGAQGGLRVDSQGVTLAQVLAFTIPNDTTTGTTLNSVAKPIFSCMGGCVIKTATTDVGGALGIVVEGAGITGQATVAVLGVVSCNFDGSVTAGDYVQISSTVSGDCHDAGSTYPASGQILGRVIVTGTGAGLYKMFQVVPEIRGP